MRVLKRNCVCVCFSQIWMELDQFFWQKQSEARQIQSRLILLSHQNPILATTINQLPEAKQPAST